ncbi:acetate--CoA ligase family protein [Coriobacteriia bacterium Es71-Z0120]|uniref:acetate--CoA ligase family protein n=1 Tax=Parvivirga hydrogeniphila TaxID=2939460 RepID=UPI0022609DB9|nr:acetate--CoA ligase [Parvivirga hydrogeniphila]MCL4079557.1 acetate--CoA ligase family protein [Parvivirga hydrogeniphila]
MLEPVFAPRSVAVIGASRDPRAVGRTVLDNLIAGGFPGALYPVNPKADTIADLPCFPSVDSLPETPDLAVIVVPAAAVEPLVRRCGEMGVPAVIVISAGFKEAGPEGAALERSVSAAARDVGIRLIGPNCLGVIVPGSRLNASFAPTMPPAGNVAFVSQSGALGTALLDQAACQGLGLSHFVSLGNKADVDEADLFFAWADDPSVAVVVAYIEAVRDGSRFVDAARAVTRAKPLVVLKSGLSDAGARAVSSHTGSLAGSKHVYEAALRKAGAIQVHSAEELFDLAAAFATQPLPRARTVCIVTNAGGPAILATDAAERIGLGLATLEDTTTRRLRAALPAAASVYNPVDVLGDAPPERYATTLDAVADDASVGAVLAVLTPQAMTDAEGVASAVADVASKRGLCTLASFMGGERVAQGIRALRERGVPNYPYPERAVQALRAMMTRLDAETSAPADAPPVEGDRDVVRAAMDHARAAQRRFITEISATRIADAYGIRVPQGGVARDLDEAIALAEKVGYPVVVKIASPDILHKSDIGGIITGVTGSDGLRAAYERVLLSARTRMPEARIWGVTVQQQIPKGAETIVGLTRDPTFGHVLMFGLGGIYVEVLHDVSFRLCPVSHRDAAEMIAEIHAYPLLKGARGQAPADVEAIADTIVRVAALARDFPEIAELDINPLIVLPKGEGAVAADVRIGIGE